MSVASRIRSHAGQHGSHRAWAPCALDRTCGTRGAVRPHRRSTGLRCADLPRSPSHDSVTHGTQQKQKRGVPLRAPTGRRESARIRRSRHFLEVGGAPLCMGTSTPTAAQTTPSDMRSGLCPFPRGEARTRSDSRSVVADRAVCRGGRPSMAARPGSMEASAVDRGDEIPRRSVIVAVLEAVEQLDSQRLCPLTIGSNGRRQIASALELVPPTSPPCRTTRAGRTTSRRRLAPAPALIMRLDLAVRGSWLGRRARSRVAAGGVAWRLRTPPRSSGSWPRRMASRRSRSRPAAWPGSVR
jgi:hypothetical protein